MFLKGGGIRYLVSHPVNAYTDIVSHFAKSAICKIWVVLQQLFSHIRLAKLIISCCFSRAAFAATEGTKTARKNQFCQTNVREKLLKDDPNLADSTFCKTTDDLSVSKKNELIRFMILIKKMSVHSFFIMCLTLFATISSVVLTN